MALAAGRGQGADYPAGGLDNRGDLPHAYAASAQLVRARPAAGPEHRAAEPAAERACPPPGRGAAGRGDTVRLGPEAGPETGCYAYPAPVREAVPGTVTDAVAVAVAAAPAVPGAFAIPSPSGVSPSPCVTVLVVRTCVPSISLSLVG
jgi:hypothetical protein